ncbi:24622_t:CDS:2, partial [Gigaspora margarita]
KNDKQVKKEAGNLEEQLEAKGLVTADIEKIIEYTKEIKLKNKDFSGQLVIADYPNLAKLYLRDDGNMDKIILKNLEQLQDLQDLVIENCPQIKKLNVKTNLLTNLEFLKSLESLEELELDNNTNINSGLEYLPAGLEKFSCNNTKLVEVLKPYQ